MATEHGIAQKLAALECAGAVTRRQAELLMGHLLAERVGLRRAKATRWLVDDARSCDGSDSRKPSTASIPAWRSIWGPCSKEALTAGAWDGRPPASAARPTLR